MEPFIILITVATIVKIYSFRKETTLTFWNCGGRLPDVSPIAETWAYCLLRNHFHAVVYIKKKEVLSGFNKPPSRYFSNFFNAYARGLNIATQRTGTLFQRPFKRILGNPSYLMRPIVYIHQNPQKHHFTEDFRDWDYLSYYELTSDAATRLQRDRVIKLFGSRADFVRIHQEIQPLEVLEDGD
jgi:putative transposase